MCLYDANTGTLVREHEWQNLKFFCLLSLLRCADMFRDDESNNTTDDDMDSLFDDIHDEESANTTD